MNAAQKVPGSNVRGALTLLGFAQKAGKLAAGEAAVENALKKDKIVLLILSSELAASRQTMWQQKAEQAQIPWLVLDAEKAEMGLAVGMSPRGVIGVQEQGMAEAIMKKIQG